MKNNLSRIIVILIVILTIVSGIIWRKEIRFFFTKEKALPKEETMPAIKISLLNGCGFAGATATVKDKLHDRNVDIVEQKNARSFIYNKTIIVVRQKDEMDLRRLMKMTGIKRYIYAINDNSFVPFEIILGDDFELYFTEK